MCSFLLSGCISTAVKYSSWQITHGTKIGTKNPPFQHFLLTSEQLGAFNPRGMGPLLSRHPDKNHLSPQARSCGPAAASVYPPRHPHVTQRPESPPGPSVGSLSFLLREGPPSRVLAIAQHSHPDNEAPSSELQAQGPDVVPTIRPLGEGSAAI